MPTYDFRNKNTGEICTKIMSIAAKEAWLLENPDMEQVHLGAPVMGDSVRLGLRKPDDSFRDKLKDMKQKHLHANINTF